jgi:SnoaL-like domain
MANSAGLDNNRLLVRKFLEALGAKDFEALRGLIDEGVSFNSPLEVLEGAAPFMRSMRNLGPMIERIDVMKIFADGADACAIYDFVTNHPTIGVTLAAEWYRVEAGKIKSMTLVFDARPYEALLKSGAAAR